MWKNICRFMLYNIIGGLISIAIAAITYIAISIWKGTKYTIIETIKALPGDIL